ncbi:30S ribosomal protein S17 [Methylacidimicrobium cyclopophantes]|uniref:Small ribosomal subunit protein uS17 n=1 Tax=Methylacidimicrobium cyclopophantes TaxID=1041766 RepID=A0A5E6M9G4_9BACT|nr:30S ribosomal protein S17 [Methylacidimicrobium cyclopophantes]
MKTEMHKKTASPEKSRASAQAPAEPPIVDSVAQPEQEAPPAVQSKGRTRTGQVVSAKMQKTIVVNVEQRVAHPLYRKIVRKHKKLYAHDEEGVAKLGDWVKIQETRPLSRLKCWRLVAVLRSASEETAV